jgi:hypothetical protein
MNLASVIFFRYPVMRPPLRRPESAVLLMRQLGGRFRLRAFALFTSFLPIFCLLMVCVPAQGQISPGPLSKAHQSLNGTTQCASCHQFGTSTPTFKCLDCHKEIARLLSENVGYHARLEMQESQRQRLRSLPLGT